MTDDESIFAAALAIPSPDQRADYLDRACAGRPDLRRQVDELLAAHATDNPLDRPPADLGRTGAYEPPAERPGASVGPYKLLQEIGEGGMGTVFMAEQTAPVRRKVALKIIKPGMDSKQVVARFEAERQALSMMDHPNIAKVLDAGTTPAGRPYFVMELVHGVPITEFCDAHQLTPRERLGLFVPVCQAIQHAHQKGVIHRDIKPGNILVTMYDDKPVPKVIDFGVAKAVEQRLTERTLFTQFGALVGTFEYMSPEQAEMNALGVDTRSDVYSLGVLLYELLTGTTPLERQRLREAALGEVVRLIKEEEPPRPSVRLSGSGTLAKVAAARRTEPAKLSALVRGELDWIVMKCLEKDRVRRYDTASALARDVERYLRDEPVEACPPTLGYRLWKARKFWVAVAVVLLIVGTLTGITLFSIWQVGRAMVAELIAATERDEALAAREIAAKERDKADAALSQLRRAHEEQQAAQYVWDMRLLPLALEAGNVAEVNRLLARHVPPPGRPDRRGFEWYYWDRQLHADLRTGRLPEVGAPRGTWAASPDGSRVARLAPPEAADPPPGARAPDALTLTVWEVATRTVVLRHRLPVTRPADQPSAGATPAVPQFSADGKRILVGWDSAGSPGFHPGVPLRPRQVLDVATGKVLLEVNSHPPRSPLLNHTEAAFSRDGRRFAAVAALPGGATAVTPGRVRVWDLDTGKEVGAPLEANDLAESPFSPDGTRLVAVRVARAGPGALLRVSVWDVSRGGERAGWDVPLAAGLYTLASSPDVARVAGVTAERPPRANDTFPLLEPGGVTLWDAATGRQLHALPLARPAGSRATAVRAFFSPDGSRLAVERYGSEFRAGENTSDLSLWDAATGKPLPPPAGFADAAAGRGAAGPAFSPDGRQLVGTAGNVLRTWDVQTGKPLLTLRGHVNPIGAWAFGPDGKRLWSLERNGLLKEWDPRPPGSAAVQFVGRFGSDVLSVFAVSPDGGRVAALAEAETGPAGAVTVRVCDTEGKQLHVLVPPPREAAPKGRAARALSSHGLALSRDGRRALLTRHDVTRAGTDPAAVRPPDLTVWDVGTGAVLLHRTLEGGQRPPAAIAPDGSSVAVVVRPPGGGAAPAVRVFDLDARRERAPLALPGAVVAAGIDFSPDGRRLAALTLDRDGAAAGKLVVWDAGSGERISTTDVEPGSRPAAESGAWPGRLPRSPDWRARLAWSPDGSRFAFAGGPWNNAVVAVRDAATGKPLATMEQPLSGDEGSGGIPCVAFSPDGGRVAAYLSPRTAGAPAAVKVWDAASGKEMLTLQPPSPGATAVVGQLKFSGDGRRLLLCKLASDPAAPRSGSYRRLLLLTTWDASPVPGRE